MRKRRTTQSRLNHTRSTYLESPKKTLSRDHHDSQRDRICDGKYRLSIHYENKKILSPTYTRDEDHAYYHERSSSAYCSHIFYRREQFSSRKSKCLSRPRFSNMRKYESCESTRKTMTRSKYDHTSVRYA